MDVQVEENMVYISRKLVLGILVFVLVLIYWAVWQKENQKAEVVFLNIGQGDAELIKLPGDIEILIDSGPSKNITAKLSEYLPFYDRDIELAILTHPHADHISGFLAVFKDYNVKNFMFSGANYDSRVYTDFMAALKAEGSKVYLAQAGDVVSFVKHPMSDKNVQNPVLHILAPFRNTYAQSFKKIHDSDIVSQLNLGNKKFLLTGDAEEELESALIASNNIEDIDVLKVGHHGSKTSTSAKLLQAAQPEEAIIQVGNNSYGHPYPAVLNRLADFGVKVFRNDQLGDVIYR